MTVHKLATDMGSGYTQGVRVGSTIHVSGQLSLDEENEIVGPAPVDDDGRILDHANMGIQMAQSYANVKKVLGELGATMDNVVEEVLYVTDMDAALGVALEVREEAYSGSPVVAATILVTPRLAFPGQLVEIKVIARV